MDVVAGDVRAGVQVEVAGPGRLDQPGRQEARRFQQPVEDIGQPGDGAAPLGAGQRDVFAQRLRQIVGAARVGRVKHQRQSLAGDRHRLAVVEPGRGEIDQLFEAPGADQFADQAGMSLDGVERAAVIVGGQPRAIEHHPHVAAEQGAVVTGRRIDVPALRRQPRPQPATDEAGGADDGGQAGHRDGSPRWPMRRAGAPA